MYNLSTPPYGQEDIEDFELGQLSKILAVRKQVQASRPAPIKTTRTKEEIAEIAAPFQHKLRETKVATDIPWDAQKAATQAQARYIVNDVIERLKPTLDKIKNMVSYSEIQTEATNEHNIITNKLKYRQEVLRKLDIISRALPSNHPVRRSICKALYEAM